METNGEITKKMKITPVFTILGQALKDWWKNLAKFIGVYLWGMLFALIPLVIMSILIALTSLILTKGTVAYTVSIISLIIVGFLAMLSVAYFYIRSYMGMFLLIKEDYRGKTFTIFKKTNHYLQSYLWVAFLTVIFIFLWALLLLIPAIIFSVFYSLAIYVFFFEGKRGMKAIKRSIQLVKGYWWAVFGRYLLLELILVLFMVLISIPMAFMEKGSIAHVVYSLFSQIINILIIPVPILFTYTIFKDLVKIKEQ